MPKLFRQEFVNFLFSEWISGMHFVNTIIKSNCEIAFQFFQTLSPAKQPLFKMRPLMPLLVMSQAQTQSMCSLVLVLHGLWLPSIGKLKALNSKWNLEGMIVYHLVSLWPLPILAFQLGLLRHHFLY